MSHKEDLLSQNWKGTKLKSYLSITGFNHIIDAIVGKERGGDGVDEGEGDRRAGPGQGEALFSDGNLRYFVARQFVSQIYAVLSRGKLS